MSPRTTFLLIFLLCAGALGGGWWWQQQSGGSASIAGLFQEAPPSPPPADHRRFRLFIAEYHLQAATDHLVERLQQVGLKPVVESVTEEGSLKAVIIGPYKERNQADRAAAEIRKMGGQLKEVWVAEEEGNFWARTGAFFYAQNALNLQAQLIKAQYPAQIRRIATQQPLFRIYLGPYEGKVRAQTVAKQVLDLGLPAPGLMPLEGNDGGS